jgi:hypothetical protein
MVQKHGWVVMSGRLNSDLNIGNRLPASFLNIAIALSKTLPSNEQPLSKLIGYAFLRRAIAE